MTRTPRLALLLLALALRAEAADPAEGLVGASDFRFRYEGRIDSRDPAGPVLIWQGTRVAIEFEGPVLALWFKHANGQNFFDASVDGRTWIAAVPEGGPVRVPCPWTLLPGRHRLSLHKRQEAAAGYVQFSGIEIAPGARSWRPPAPVYAIAMEFIGDSISAGACNEDGAEDQWENRSTHDSELSYAALTAAAFHADYRNISVSGMGVVEGWVKPHLGQIWDRLYPSADSPATDLKEWTPDVVFVEIGDNDDSYTRRHNEGFPLLFTEKLTEVIRSIRKARPQAQIILVRGGMKGGFDSAPLKASWDAAAAQLEAGDPRIHHYFIQHWSVTHPRVADDRAMADELVTWLRGQAFMPRSDS